MQAGRHKHIFSGVEEARLIYLGVARSLGSDNEHRLVVDISGGSTELILGQLLEALQMNSFYHPLTRADLRSEANFFSVIDYKLTLQ